MKKNSIVWKFFDRVEDKGRCIAVICQLCEIEYRFFGNTTNLRSHLSRKHPIQWELANQNKSDFDCESLGRRSSIIYTVDNDLKNTISIADDEEGATAAAFIQDLEKRTSDEEWLEDLYETVDYTPKPKKIKLKRRIKREVDDSDNDRLANLYLQSPVKHERYDDTPVEKQTDEYSAFGEYIANKLRKIKSTRTRGNIQQIITTILWQAEYGTYDDADSVRNLFLTYTHNSSMNEKQGMSSDNIHNSKTSDNLDTEVGTEVVTDEII